MLIRVNPSLNLETMRWTCERAYEYTGPLVFCKGDPTAQNAEQNQETFANTLMGIFQKQYSTQQNTLNFLQQQIQPQIQSGGIGYSPDALAAMRTSASDTIAQNAQNARQAAMEGISARSGGSKLVGAAGTTAQIAGAIDAAQAAQESQAQNAITLQNANLKNANYWNAINVLNGTAAQENPLGYSGAATEASGTVAPLSQAITAANGPTFGQILGGLAGGAGTALAGAKL